MSARLWLLVNARNHVEVKPALMLYVLYSQLKEFPSVLHCSPSLVGPSLTTGGGDKLLFEVGGMVVPW